MKKLRAAVVGVGYLGNFHAQKYKNNSEVELVAICDSSSELLTKRSQELQVPGFNNPKDLLRKIDLVTIAASTTYHYELASLFLESGIPVNVEKPMTATLEQAEKLLEINQKTKTLLTVGHIERFNPAVNKLKELLDSKAYHFELTRWATYKARGADVSVVYDLMIHDLDLLFYLTDSEVSEFFVSGAPLASNELDSVQGSFKMVNGQSATLSISRVSPKMIRNIKAYSKETIVNANTGTLEIEVQTMNPSPQNPDDKILNKSIQLNKVDALQEETNHFIACVQGKEVPKISIMDGFKAMAWADKITKSLS